MEHVRVVLVDTKDPLNLGAVARAMQNFGLSDLVLVNPLTDDLVTARRVAVHAEHLLESPLVVKSLAEATADCVFVVGTSSRAKGGPNLVSPRAVAREAAGASGKVALVFGGEQSGLSNADLSRCHAVSCVPAHPSQPSLNLAQAVAVFGYELFDALTAQPSRLASRVTTEAGFFELEGLLREALRTAGFAEPDRPGHGTVELVAPLRRAGLTQREARVWTAALHALRKGATRGAWGGGH